MNYGKQQKGYIGQSRSYRSLKTINDFEVPMSLINKDTLSDLIDEYSESEQIALKEVSIAKWKYIAKELIGAASWHHTGKFYQQTLHYNLRETANYILSEGMEEINKLYKAYRETLKPSPEKEFAMEVKRQHKEYLKEMKQLLPYQERHKTLNNFIKHNKIPLEELRKTRIERLDILRQSLRKQWEKQLPKDHYNFTRIHDDEFIETYYKKG